MNNHFCQFGLNRHRVKLFAHSVTLTFFVLAVTTLHPGSKLAASTPTLIPANYNAVTDASGFRWDVQSYGQIQYGQNNTFSGAAVMTINGSSFRSQSQKMTSDGKEYFIQGSSAGLSITRRIRIDTKLSAVRYVEIFHNPTSKPVTASIILQTGMGRTNIQQLVTETRGSALVKLGDKDGGVLAYSNPAQTGGQLSFIWDFGSPRSKVKPTLRNENNYRFYFTYNLTVPAQKKVALLHGLAQRSINVIPDAKGMKTLFKPFRSRNWTRDLPSDVRKALVNASGSPFGDWAATNALAALDALDVERGAFDILAVGEKTRLRGNTQCDDVTIKTDHGSTTVSWENIAAVVGSATSLGSSSVLLRDGQLFRGEISYDQLQFTMNSGVTMNLSAGQLDRLITKVSHKDGIPPQGVFALLETVDGARMALSKNDSQFLAVVTPWGERQLSWDNIVQMQSSEDGVGYRFRLQDGSQLFGYLNESTIRVNTMAFGELELAASDIKTIMPAQRGEADEQGLEDSALPYVSLAGENVLVGQVDMSNLNFILSGQKVPVPLTQIRVMRNLFEESDGPPIGLQHPIFEVELWDGGVINGQIVDTILPVRSGDQVYRVRTGDVVEMTRPTPVVPESLRRTIANQIRELGNDEFTKREAATKALIELGHLAKQQLSDAAGQVADAEVRRRVEKILSEIDD